jgi:putative membrane protein
MMGPWRFFGGWMWLFPLIMLCILVVVAIILIRRYGGLQQAFNAIFSKIPMQPDSRVDSNEQKSETALDILKKRYAKGEITREQFEEMKKNL